MKKLTLIFCLCILQIISFAQENKFDVAIIPEPVSIIRNGGKFTLPKNVVIRSSSSSEVDLVTKFLSNKISRATGFTVKENNTSPKYTIRLILNKDANAVLGNEGYQLSVTPKNVLIRANKPAGLFYGAQSFIQLLPKEIESATVVKNIDWSTACVDVEDYPRFVWRGLMLDVARHFFGKEDVKRYIDDMVRYKFNILHLHLSDDEGWRIEIKGYPKLTEVGAWRVKRTGYFNNMPIPTPEEPRNYGGFYTQEDIKELVAYAKDRFVNILPEIDVPGHSLAAVVSYPELSCTPEANTYNVRSGEQIMDWSKGHPPIALYDNTLCPANEKAYQFLDTVVSQVAKLFPFEYIHMGGDECPKNYWEKDPQIKALMKKENLKTMDDVQTYFTNRVDKIVQSKGKKLIGWNEILQGEGLSKSAAVMNWLGTDGPAKAAKEGRSIVMTPTEYCYLDYMQGDPSVETKIYSTLRLNKTYQFEPVPNGIDPKLILGGQGNLWTEQVYNMRTAEYMTWPRAFAISESLWSPKEKKNWDNFFGKVEKQFERFNIASIKYSPSVYDPIVNTSMGENGQLIVDLATEVKDLDIYYSFDNSFPDQFYPKYTQPLLAPKESFQLKMITYKNGKPIGRMMAITMEDLKSRVKAK
ncbi:MAG: family 20 glycosylhydrolase [Bacteroidetes bacterium]|nr:family 20 glycosylhydrolase [Bacteroidota bacterium]MBU1485538.1 family 20 glycosylhydrolase [Bacteroidota bacterium]MBU1760798.1 family 20 glycosylhydrolase [Bacteroidota bacterium]MBU2269036.1 family 20 glycosylhydrolase [Bacteroidota bacterium]MBU2376894.1 family 20 glycosylhydrolase [Bacteroidota bacterium]